MSTLNGWLERHPRMGFVGLAVFFVLQCLVCGWGHWGSALMSTVIFGSLMGTFQYLYVLRPRLRAREQEK